MEIEILPLHYGHSDGHTDITYSADGERLITCGGDGDVRIWNGFDDDDPFQTALGEFVLCTKHKGEHLIVAGDSSKVQLVQFPAGERDGILARFTAQVNHIAVSQAHNWVAVASDDMTVQVIETDSRTVKSLPPMNGPVLSVAIDHSHQHVAVSCGDGVLHIIDFSASPRTVKELPVVPKANAFEHAEILCRTDFDAHNKYFAYPDGANVVLLNVDDWSEAYRLTSKIARPLSIVTFTPSGNYLAGATLDGDVIVWSTQTQTVLGYVKHPKEVAITAVCWNPKENGELAFSDAEGYIGLAVNCWRSGGRTVSTAGDEVDEVEAEAGDGEEQRIDDEFQKAFGGDDDDDDNENAISLEKLKREVMGDDDATAAAARSRSPSPRPRSRTPEPPLQEAFMPSSTPEHMDPRYMCWNDVAVIRCYGGTLDEGEEGSRSIEVEFHDSSFHSSMMMANFNAYTMGSISSAALAVANSNQINVVPLSSNKDWTLQMSEDDDTEIVALATSPNLICFGTNKHRVHVCSVYGVQRAILSVPGAIIAMSAAAHVLMVAYHAATWRKGDACVDVLLVKFDGMSMESRNLKAPLAPLSSVQWIGFSDLGTPVMVDSSGMVYVFPMQANVWVPMCDTRRDIKSPIDGFFVTAVYESLGTVRGIRCRGSIYPGFTSIPIVIELPLMAPFMGMDVEKHQLEANLFTWSTLQVENSEKKFKEVALKAFALSAKNNYDQRALELIEMLQNPAIMNLGLKYASKLGKNRLAEKLTELAEKLRSSGEADEEEPAEAVNTPSNLNRSNHRLVLTSTGKILNKLKISTTPSNSPGVSRQELPSTPIHEATPSPLSIITTQEMAILNDEPRNPFLKSLKKSKPDTYNPLSLTDKFAGVNEEKGRKEKENHTDKRKVSDISPGSGSGKEKQRKLNAFVFKRT